MQNRVDQGTFCSSGSLNPSQNESLNEQEILSLYTRGNILHLQQPAVMTPELIQSSIPAEVSICYLYHDTTLEQLQALPQSISTVYYNMSSNINLISSLPEHITTLIPAFKSIIEPWLIPDHVRFVMINRSVDTLTLQKLARKDVQFIIDGRLTQKQIDTLNKAVTRHPKAGFAICSTTDKNSAAKLTFKRVSLQKQPNRDAIMSINHKVTTAVISSHNHASDLKLLPPSIKTVLFNPDVTSEQTGVLSRHVKHAIFAKGTSESAIRGLSRHIEKVVVAEDESLSIRNLLQHLEDQSQTGANSHNMDSDYRKMLQMFGKTSLQPTSCKDTTAAQEQRQSPTVTPVAPFRNKRKSSISNPLTESPKKKLKSRHNIATQEINTLQNTSKEVINTPDDKRSIAVKRARYNKLSVFGKQARTYHNPHPTTREKLSDKRPLEPQVSDYAPQKKIKKYDSLLKKTTFKLSRYRAEPSAHEQRQAYRFR